MRSYAYCPAYWPASERTQCETNLSPDHEPDTDLGGFEEDAFESVDERKERRKIQMQMKKQKRIDKARGNTGERIQCTATAVFGRDWMEPTCCAAHAELGMKQVGFKDLPFDQDEFVKINLVDKYMSKPKKPQALDEAGKFFQETKELMCRALQNMTNVNVLNDKYGGNCHTYIENALKFGLRDALSKEDFMVARCIRRLVVRLKIMAEHSDMGFQVCSTDRAVHLMPYRLVFALRDCECTALATDPRPG